MERTDKQPQVKILTNSGYKYFGLKISVDSSFIEILDERQGKIKIPLANISFMQEVSK